MNYQTQDISRTDHFFVSMRSKLQLLRAHHRAADSTQYHERR